ncbi:outer membrane beta-barrel protein [Vibrio algarum]|uniref:Outer membrane beta-barrel protein n=1 Tax=Vibrio algarum TaxID=3020714 RepID=A0ABT4YMV7_9VIBR|nr:outer membrane beta-barrel protein [Vibrio sp. KJ40-1]MDB1122732.1 outer membrane beta-barrel protein [Vibrio sp. KJ40-1]
MKTYLLSASILLLLSMTAHAKVHSVQPIKQNKLIETHQNNEHIYIGLRGGWTNFQDACSSGSSECNNNTSGFGLYGGYQFTPWFALEAAVTDYGSPNARYGASKVSADILGSELTGLFSYDVSQHFDIYLRAGAAYQNIDKESGSIAEQTSNEWGIVSAVGLDYLLSENWSLRGEYQFIDGIGNDELMQADMHFISLGLTYHFGQKKPFTTRLTQTMKPTTEIKNVSNQASIKNGINQ